jgi:CRP/FNR family cyclic AMP-dependent transcriptional regulator
VLNQGASLTGATIKGVSDAVVRLLESDRELGEDLDPARLAAAIERVRAPVIALSRGLWRPPEWPQTVRVGAGLLIVDGMILRRVGVEGRFGAELLSAGDLMRPWQREDLGSSLQRKLSWQVLDRARIAILDLDVMRRLAEYPEIHGRLVARALRRSRRLALHIAIVHQPKVETRLHMLLWHLADRWGTVRADGVSLPVRLTHETLAELTAARRPTVSSAIGALERSGALERTGEGWLLHGPPPGELEELVDQTGARELGR